MFARRVILTLVRVTHFTHYPIYNLSIYWLFLSAICIDLHSVVDILVDFEPMYPGFESRESYDFFFHFFYVFFLSLLLQCKFAIFSITVSSQILLLYYPLWCPGLQRLQRFDFLKYCGTCCLALYIEIYLHGVSVNDTYAILKVILLHMLRIQKPVIIAYWPIWKKNKRGAS